MVNIKKYSDINSDEKQQELREKIRRLHSDKNDYFKIMKIINYDLSSKLCFIYFSFKKTFFIRKKLIRKLKTKNYKN